MAKNYMDNEIVQTYYRKWINCPTLLDYPADIEYFIDL